MSEAKDSEGTPKRVSLTKKQCATATGQELITFLCELIHDGFVTQGGLYRLVAWLAGRSDSDIPAVTFLTRLVNEKVCKAEFTTQDAFDIHFAIERVLPKDVRNHALSSRQLAWSHTPASDRQIEYIRNLGGTPTAGMTRAEASVLLDKLEPRATEKQLAFIADLGGTPSPELSKRGASELIERLLWEAESKPSPRQIMVLRFWGRMDLAKGPRQRITDWLERFYKEDPRRKLAWEAFKIESGDNGSEQDPSRVPIGIGDTYLEKVPHVPLAQPPEPPDYCNTSCPSCGIHIEHEPYNPDQHSRWVACPQCGGPVDLAPGTREPPLPGPARPLMVTCNCNACSGEIQFNEDGFDPHNPPTVACPHCGKSTVLYIPAK
jgi:DNA-directed RNA polymerase subunit RPC12/RpoP/phage FluMu protein gp41